MGDKVSNSAILDACRIPETLGRRRRRRRRPTLVVVGFARNINHPGKRGRREEGRKQKGRKEKGRKEKGRKGKGRRVHPINLQNGKLSATRKKNRRRSGQEGFL